MPESSKSGTRSTKQRFSDTAERIAFHFINRPHAALRTYMRGADIKFSGSSAIMFGSRLDEEKQGELVVACNMPHEFAEVDPIEFTHARQLVGWELEPRCLILGSYNEGLIFTKDRSRDWLRSNYLRAAGEILAFIIVNMGNTDAVNLPQTPMSRFKEFLERNLSFVDLFLEDKKAWLTLPAVRAAYTLFVEDKRNDHGWTRPAFIQNNKVPTSLACFVEFEGLAAIIPPDDMVQVEDWYDRKPPNEQVEPEPVTLPAVEEVVSVAVTVDPNPEEPETPPRQTGESITAKEIAIKFAAAQSGNISDRHRECVTGDIVVPMQFAWVAMAESGIDPRLVEHLVYDLQCSDPKHLFGNWHDLLTFAAMLSQHPDRYLKISDNPTRLRDFAGQVMELVFEHRKNKKVHRFTDFMVAPYPTYFTEKRGVCHWCGGALGAACGRNNATFDVAGGNPTRRKYPVTYFKCTNPDCADEEGTPKGKVYPAQYFDERCDIAGAKHMHLSIGAAMVAHVEGFYGKLQISPQEFHKMTPENVGVVLVPWLKSTYNIVQTPENATRTLMWAFELLERMVNDVDQAACKWSVGYPAKGVGHPNPEVPPA